MMSQMTYGLGGPPYFDANKYNNTTTTTNDLPMEANCQLDASNPSNPVRKISKSESIHSGHFMISEIEENDTLADKDGDGDKQQGLLPQPDYQGQAEDVCESSNGLVVSNYACNNVVPHTSLYGSKTSASVVQIDENLSKLFKCMSLAYNGKITSPKWKAFKGVNLTMKDKIRLNNIIWRAWHIQCKSHS